MNYEPNQNNQDQNSFNQPENGSGYFTADPSFTAPLIDEKPPVKQTFAVAALVLGIIGLVCNCCCFCLPFVCSVLAIIFACVDRSKAGSFRGYALVGLILGILGAVWGLVTMVEIIYIFNDPAMAEFFEIYMEALETGDMTALEDWLAQNGELIGAY